MWLFDVEGDEREVLVSTKGPGGFSQEVQVFGTGLFGSPTYWAFRYWRGPSGTRPIGALLRAKKGPQGDLQSDYQIWRGTRLRSSFS